MQVIVQNVGGRDVILAGQMLYPGETRVVNLKIYDQAYLTYPDLAIIGPDDLALPADGVERLFLLAGASQPLPSIADSIDVLRDADGNPIPVPPGDLSDAGATISLRDGEEQPSNECEPVELDEPAPKRHPSPQRRPDQRPARGRR